MADAYERDKQGNVTGKRTLEHPQKPSDPAPSINSRPVDKPTGNSTLASRAKGEKPKPMPEKNPYGNSTLSERAKASKKRVGKAEDKSVAKADTK